MADRPADKDKISTETDQPASESASNDMWGGRFSGGPSDIMARINVSIGFDRRLYRQDIAGSTAHARMLVEQGVISAEDGTAITDGLERVRGEIEDGTFPFRDEYEDIHLNIEARLRELIGSAAGRLHTGRSRNDQVATDFRLWVRDEIDAIDEALKAYQAALIDQAERGSGLVMPGFTHLQNAQPVTFGHHLLAYVEMAGRDRGRFADCRKRLNQSPLGAAALAGTPYPIDRDRTAAAMGFDSPMVNSLDAVSARDFALEFLGAASICAIHLSRLAEEIVLWCSDGFGFVSLSDAFTTGSSIMPQKRNPDAAELARAKAGRIVGALNSLSMMMKALPLTYSKDMQEDKEPTFEAADALMLCLAAMTGMVSDMTPNPDRMRAAAERGFTTATDFADWLVRELDVPFRDAHHMAGSAVAEAERRGVRLDELPIDVFTGLDGRIDNSVYEVLTVDSSVAARTSFGGTAPDNVRSAVAAARERYLA